MMLMIDDLHWRLLSCSLYNYICCRNRISRQHWNEEGRNVVINELKRQLVEGNFIEQEAEEAAGEQDQQGLQD